MAFNDFREPIEYVVDQHWRSKQFTGANVANKSVQLSHSSKLDDTLPEYPMKLFKDENGDIYKIVYGDLEALEKIANGEEGIAIIWQEEFLRDDEGNINLIRTTYPDGLVVDLQIVRENEDITGIKNI